ncbi:annexin D3 isoform X2 [Capsella rubella]|uniref:annexin D3 isoform X2 n=1 Tax=Capsella rubella TaxID=81985 RepID=UPI000CD53E15|nr:annexin D3 isoform X2 [Capsella rubella]
MATIRVPDQVPSPAQDSETLNHAFRGWGTDEKAVIRVLGQRNKSQIRKIRESYREIYGKDLIDDLSSELSGDFMKAVVSWVYDPAERDARLVNKILNKEKKKKKGVENLKVLVEISCTTSPDHLIAVRKAYCSLFDSSLEEHIASTLPFPLAKFLVTLASSFRYDKDKTDAEVATIEAAMLREAIEKKQLDHDHVLYILGTRSIYQLRETFVAYKQSYGITIDKVQIHGFGLDFEGCPGDADLRSLLQTAIFCIDTPEKHFAKVVRDSIEGFGTDEDSLTRAIVTRAEIDLMKVRGEYFNMYNTSMDNAIVGDISGYYKDFLITLLGSKI